MANGRRILPEVLAGEVRTLHMHRKARDLCDLWRLLRRSVPVEDELVEAFRLVDGRLHPYWGRRDWAP